MGALELRRINALLRFYLKVDPETLEDDEWAKAWGDLRWALNYEAERTSKDLNI